MAEDIATMRAFVARFTITTPILREGDLHEAGPTLVLPDSPHRLRAAVYSFALAFRREMHYDFVQFPVPHDRSDRRWEAWLWPASEARYLTLRSVAVGGACFRREEWKGIRSPIWTACWIWIHPYFRRQRFLSNAWDTFLRRYDNFILELPLSDAMKRFADGKHLSRIGRTYTARPLIDGGQDQVVYE